jgi:hypothetical protein
MAIPHCAVLSRSPTAKEAIVNANTSPAEVTRPGAGHRSYDADSQTVVAFFLEPGHQQQVVIGTHRQQDDDAHHDHDPVQMYP